MKKTYFNLLKKWCDALIDLQFKDKGDPTLYGGFHCRACHILHGRASDAVYPFLVMAKHTGEEKYINAAKAVFDFGQNFVCDDGAVLNDGQSQWKGITVFSATAICEALTVGGHLLDTDTRTKWEKRLRAMGEWLYENMTEHMVTNINYPATNCAALTLLGNYFGREDYLAQGKHLAEYVMARITENGFLYGEGKPRDEVSPLGCVAVDIGYNMEESLPSLVKYAYIIKDEKLLERLSDILLRQLDFMLPDGAWDNSFGTRNYKWTYWGSRTSDGCASAYTLLSDRNPVFAEAARRNTELVEKCTHAGLLHGGPHYHKHGEQPCTHHTFEHANAIAFALEHSENMPTERVDLPCDTASSLAYYPEINTYKLAIGSYRATVTGNDSNARVGGHVCGGTLSLLWKYGEGPMIAASVTEYTLIEAHNMQLPRYSNHRPLTPCLVKKQGDTLYTTACFRTPEMTASEENGKACVKVSTGLCNNSFKRMEGDSERVFTYTLSADGMRIKAENAHGTEFILPLISGEMKLLCGEVKAKEEIFFLTGGFEACEYTITPDENGSVELMII
ncbi:MAG: hypothetical protein IKU43_11535 [Clostridia bacterium]|nr:hypothetical protein [Clostridia bacterium]